MVSADTWEVSADTWELSADTKQLSADTMEVSVDSRVMSVDTGKCPWTQGKCLVCVLKPSVLAHRVAKCHLALFGYITGNTPAWPIFSNVLSPAFLSKPNPPKFAPSENALK